MMTENDKNAYQLEALKSGVFVYKNQNNPEEERYGCPTCWSKDILIILQPRQNHFVCDSCKFDTEKYGK